MADEKPPPYSPPASSKSSLTSRPSTGSLRAAHPPSPRSSSRHPSVSSQQSMADILSSPPKQEGVPLRDWRTVKVGELLSNRELLFVDLDTPVESACQVSPPQFQHPSSSIVRLISRSIFIPSSNLWNTKNLVNTSCSPVVLRPLSITNFRRFQSDRPLTRSPYAGLLTIAT